MLPRIVITGLSGGVGKTLVSLGLTRALANRGLRVHPFKKGPDYIDTAWLAAAAGNPAWNLDPFFLDETAMRRHFARRAAGANIALIEGNRGFFDGSDLHGSTSTAEVARRLDVPVILVVDITKMTRTTAAVVLGCRNFPGGERIAGVILNRAAGPRHADLARRAVEELAGMTVLGVLPRLKESPIFERHDGLITVEMHTSAEEALEATAALIEQEVDLDAVTRIASQASDLEMATDTPSQGMDAGRQAAPHGPAPRVGVVRDEALWQYYEENLQALDEAGAEVVFLSLQDGAPWPELDGLYLGGGDLGQVAGRLSADANRLGEIRNLVESGLPVYAEGAGYWYLAETLVINGEHHPMAGIFPATVSLGPKPAFIGYVQAETVADTPFCPADSLVRGHEFHYASITFHGPVSYVWRKDRGLEGPDGLVYKNAFGSAMQVYAPAVPQWAEGLTAAARRYRTSQGR